MPFYRVWYRNNDEPLTFSTPGRCTEEQILDHVFEHEKIVPFTIGDANPGNRPAKAPTLQELIARNNLAPVRYTEDESEIYTLG